MNTFKPNITKVKRINSGSSTGNEGIVIEHDPATNRCRVKWYKGSTVRTWVQCKYLIIIGEEKPAEQITAASVAAMSWDDVVLKTDELYEQYHSGTISEDEKIRVGKTYGILAKQANKMAGRKVLNVTL